MRVVRLYKISRVAPQNSRTKNISERKRGITLDV